MTRIGLEKENIHFCSVPNWSNAEVIATPNDTKAQWKSELRNGLLQPKIQEFGLLLSTKVTKKKRIQRKKKKNRYNKRKVGGLPVEDMMNANNKSYISVEELKQNEY